MTVFVWNKTVIGWEGDWTLRLRPSMVHLSPATQLLMYYVKLDATAACTSLFIDHLKSVDRYMCCHVRR